jgi:2-C-methyl-D-erythritol 4-phosphate cytidylyltransferase
MAVALIVAAGRGERLGAGRPKALVTLAGKPMVEWSLDALRALRAGGAIQRIVVALPEGVGLDTEPDVVTVPGGATRSQSVLRALRASGDGDPVIVHDAARPLAPPGLFERALDELERTGADAAIAAAPVSDTIKQVGDDGRTVQATLDRRRLWAVQTPQVFRREALERVLGEASTDLLAAATDDAWLIERAGGTVHVVCSDSPNIKVTSPIDLELAELMLSKRTR